MSMRQYVIHICYQTKDNQKVPIRERGLIDQSIHEIDLVAHSIQDAKAAFSLWQFNTHRENIINGGRPKFKIVAAAKLAEVVATESRKKWLRLHPEQVRSQIYVCPHCQNIGQIPAVGCDYRYCPRCGKEVIQNEKIKDEAN